MRNIIKPLIALLIVAITPGVTLAQDDARHLAKAAFYSIEEKPFDSERVAKAIEDIKRAEKLNPKEPWVAIAISRAILAAGYDSGSPHSIKSYAAEAVKQADAYAKQGAVLGPSESVAYSQLARIQIILENYQGARDALNQAYQKDNNDFYPWYLRGVVSLKMRDSGRANAALDEAEQRATLPYQRRLVIRERITLARMSQDKEAEERYCKQAIAIDPQDAHSYGNYGNFLLGQKRYDDAMANLEKAVSISPYPLAKELLQRARLLRASSAK